MSPAQLPEFRDPIRDFALGGGFAFHDVGRRLRDNGAHFDVVTGSARSQGQLAPAAPALTDWIRCTAGDADGIKGAC